jgi:uncharacterized protein YndB with AHSA1/START domain
MAAKNKSSAGTIRITRIFNAPRSLVFAAWTQSKHLKQWSAPHGFTLPVSRGDLRIGGKWSACMVSPEGEKLWLGGIYREVIKNRKLVFTHAWKGGDEETLVTVRFEDHVRGTRIIFEQSGFASAGSRDGHKGGWKECFDRLATHLQGRSARKS